MRWIWVGLDRLAVLELWRSSGSENDEMSTCIGTIIWPSGYMLVYSCEILSCPEVLTPRVTSSEQTEALFHFPVLRPVFRWIPNTPRRQL